MQDTINHTLVQEFVHHILGKPVGGSDKDAVVDFIKVIFIFQEWDLESILCWRFNIPIDNPAQSQSTKRHNERCEEWDGVELDRLGMLCQRPAHKFMQPVRDQPAKDRE